MHPAELLDRRVCGANAVLGDVLAGETDAIAHVLEKIGPRLAILDRKSDEVGRRPATPPVHAQKQHAVATVDGERKWCRSVLASDPIVRIHARLPQSTGGKSITVVR